MWGLFHDSPARRDTYITINRSDQFPLMFCQTRWVEDVPVATRALEIWSFVVAVVEHFQALPSSRRPLNNKSDGILVKDHKDNSIKFRFFIDIANILAPFLKQFQIDDPVMPFMDEVLATIIRRIMKIFLLRSVVNDVVTSHQLIKLDITKKGFLPQLAVKLPTASKALLSTLEISSSKKIKLIDYKRNYSLKSLLLIMFHNIPISLTLLMYPCKVWINFEVNFFTKISSTNQCGKFLFSFLPCHMGKAKLKEVLVLTKK